MATGRLRPSRRPATTSTTTGEAAAQGCRAPGAAPQRPAVRLRALEEPGADVGDTNDARPGARHSPAVCRGSTEARSSHPNAREQARDQLDRARSLLHDGDGDREEHSARSAIPRWQAFGSGGQARRAGGRGATPARRVRPVRRLEGARPGLSRAALVVLSAVAPLALATSAAADVRKPPREPGPPIVTIGRYSQQDDRTRASIGASVRGRQERAGP